MVVKSPTTGALESRTICALKRDIFALAISYSTRFKIKDNDLILMSNSERCIPATTHTNRFQKLAEYFLKGKGTNGWQILTTTFVSHEGRSRDERLSS